MYPLDVKCALRMKSGTHHARRSAFSSKRSGETASAAEGGGIMEVRFCLPEQERFLLLSPAGYDIIIPTNRDIKRVSELENEKTYRFSAQLCVDPESGGAYIVFPFDIRKAFGKGRVKVHATFDGVPYDGSIVNMGVKDENGNICYVIGVLKSIRKQLGKSNGDILEVQIWER